MPTPDNLELHCPNCDYDVRGLPTARCPECGAEFDAAELVAVALGGVKRGLPAGYDPLSLWCTVLIKPVRFVRRFPARHDPAVAWIYTLLCYVFAALVFGVGAATIAGGPAAVIVAIIAGTGVACLVCEVLIAVALAICVRPMGIRRYYHFWRGLTHYTSGFTLFTAIWGLLAAHWGVGNPLSGDFEHWWLWAVAMLIFGWWAGALISMVLARAGWRPGSVLGALLIIVIGIGCVYLGFGLSFSIGFAIL